MAAKAKKEYGNESISTLKGADRVRKRPGVIFGSDGLEGCEHSVFEILSNAIDEARQGYGKKLLDYSMEKAKEMGAGALAITGNILFYGKSGFVPAKTKGVRYADDPEADYFLIRELRPGFLDGISGTYKDPVGYFACEKDPEGFERFEATFPKKEKRKLTGQLF